METVRTRIVREIVLRLAALTDVFGKVVRGLDESLEVASVTNAGKAVVEVFIGDDQELDPQENSVSSFAFQVVLLIYLPEPGDSSLAADWDGVADAVLQAAYSTFAGGSQHTFGGLAQDTSPAGGGGISFGENGEPQTACMFRVQYGHVIGDPTSPS
ncbi:MAG: hypothetical protein IT435_16075 [Phycisphaerales bacterium]|nr:hypothetical protein [Phycisphaerales bacterium]